MFVPLHALNYPDTDTNHKKQTTSPQVVIPSNPIERNRSDTQYTNAQSPLTQGKSILTAIDAETMSFDFSATSPSASPIKKVSEVLDAGAGDGARADADADYEAVLGAVISFG